MTRSPQLRRASSLSALALVATTIEGERTHAQFFLPDSPPSQQQQQQSSSRFDLVWTTAAAPPFAQLELPHHFDAKVNRLPGAELLTSPDALSHHVAAQQKRHGKFFFDFVPAHYELPRDAEQLPGAYLEARQQSDLSPDRGRDPEVQQRFRLRERAVNGDDESTTGAEVFVTDGELQLKLESTTFKGKVVVVDKYIEPLLLDGHKFRAGFYVAVTSTNPLRVYAYDHPLIQIAKAEYPSRLGVDADPKAYTFDQYIAPWDFPDLQADFHELPSANREGTNAWHVLKRYLRKQGIDTKHLQDEVDSAIAKAVLSSRGHLQSEQAKVKRAAGREGEKSSPSDLSDSFFELWKFNFEFDDVGKPWLVRVVSNPSMMATPSVFGTDEAIKKRLLHDLANLVGVHPQAQLRFEKFFRPGDGGAFCSDKCRDRNRAWDASCWSCPGWFASNVARRLFAASTEYARRGSFNLLFPSVEHEWSRFMDTQLSEYDIAFDRYLKSLSSGYANLADFPASDRAVTCVYREHCSNHGDCVNGLCSCDDKYEGRTCYVPKATNEEQHHPQQETGRTWSQDTGTWMEKVESLVWSRGDVPKSSNRPMAGGGDAFASSTVLLVVLLGILLFVMYRLVASRRSESGSSDLPYDGKAM
uniref:Tubulin--tyrosine ligase-like protein 5 n=1 Tax=Peronospora matthiolae TaxID=2874970 RepID=A0AAV1TU12_9STRA